MKPANEFGHILGYGWRGKSQPYLADPTYSRAALDDLKYTQEQLLSTLERPEITDTLGRLALELHETAQLLEPTEIIDDNEKDTSKALDWRDKDIIPLLGDVNFTAPAALAPMPAQRKIIREKLVCRGYDDTAVCRVESRLDELCNNQLAVEADGVSGAAGVCLYKTFPLVFMGGEAFQWYSRPYVGILSSGFRVFDVATLSHETTHALDLKQTAITDFMAKEDRSCDRLKKELRAYAVEYYVENYLSDLRNVAQRTTPVSHEVERIRREVNGPVDSEDAFAVHDDLMRRIGRAGLDYIYKEVV